MTEVQSVRSYMIEVKSGGHAAWPMRISTLDQVVSVYIKCLHKICIIKRVTNINVPSEGILPYTERFNE